MIKDNVEKEFGVRKTVRKSKQIYSNRALDLTIFGLYFVHRYLALESMCLLATSEFSHEAVKKHQETVITALKVCDLQKKGSRKITNFSQTCVFIVKR